MVRLSIFQDFLENPSKCSHFCQQSSAINQEAISEVSNETSKGNPEIILHPISLEPVQRNDPRYRLIYLILQDEHVARQREWYDSHKGLIGTSALQFLLLPLSWPDIILLLVLRERFDPNERQDWEKYWAWSASEWMKKEHPICTICGVHSLGDMCRDINKPLTKPFFIHAKSALCDPFRWREGESIVNAFV